jgi:histone deacetylase 1/2
MATIGNPLGDDEIVSYILAGLGEDHKNFTTLMTVIAANEDFTLSDLYRHLTAYEARTGGRSSGGHNDAAFQHSANNTYRGGGRGFQRGGGGRGRGDGGRGNGGGRYGGYNGGGYNGGGYNGGGYNGGGHGGGRGDGSGRDGNAQGGGRGRGGNKSTCQICGIYGHDALRCYSRFNHAIQPETSNRAAAHYSNTSDGGFNSDANWYLDSGATDHMTNDLERLHVHENYRGNEQIQVANGKHIPILHIGDSSLSGSTRNLHLSNVLHSPYISKNLLSTHKLANDNDCFVEIHPSSFCVKDLKTRATLLRGRAHGGLYPVPPHQPHHRRCLPQAHSIALSKEPWHRRLGHPAPPIVQAILQSNKLGPLQNNGVPHVCDACQQAKLHQLPYAVSSRVSTSPLELVHTDVWGPAIRSAGGFRYYVSFLDDFSKFTWVYLLKHKSDVEHVFYQFQKRVELSLGTKILSVQSDWGGEYQKLHQYFNSTGISHRISCPHTHQQNGAIERKHRHLVETALALLAQSSAPLRFWDQLVT